MSYVELSNGYDSELAEARGRVSKSKPVMAVAFANNMVVDVTQGTQKQIDAWIANKFGGFQVVDKRKGTV